MGKLDSNENLYNLVPSFKGRVLTKEEEKFVDFIVNAYMQTLQNNNNIELKNKVEKEYKEWQKNPSKYNKEHGIMRQEEQEPNYESTILKMPDTEFEYVDDDWELQKYNNYSLQANYYNNKRIKKKFIISAMVVVGTIIIFVAGVKYHGNIPSISIDELISSLNPSTSMQNDEFKNNIIEYIKESNDDSSSIIAEKLGVDERDCEFIDGPAGIGVGQKMEIRINNHDYDEIKANYENKTKISKNAPVYIYFAEQGQSVYMVAEELVETYPEIKKCRYLCDEGMFIMKKLVNYIVSSNQSISSKDDCNFSGAVRMPLPATEYELEQMKAEGILHEGYSY